MLECLEENVLVFFPSSGRTARCQPTDTGRDRAQTGTAAGSELRKAASAASRGQRPALGAAGSPRSAAPSPLAAWQPGTSAGSAATTQPLVSRPPYPISLPPYPVPPIPFSSRSPFPHPALRDSAAPPSGRSVPREPAASPPRGRGSLRPRRHLGEVLGAAFAPGLRCWTVSRLPCWGVASALLRTGCRVLLRCPWVLYSPTTVSAWDKTRSTLFRHGPEVVAATPMLWQSLGMSMTARWCWILLHNPTSVYHPLFFFIEIKSMSCSEQHCWN